MSEDKANPDLDTNLDPDDWDAYRAQVHSLADTLVDRMMTMGEKPVWTQIPDSIKAALTSSIPQEGVGADAALAEAKELILPYANGNPHPRFMGWVQGGGTSGGMMAAMIESTMNNNVGGREHAAVYVEKQVIRWMCDLFEFPGDASGLLTSGTSMATLNALVIARTRLLGKLTDGEKVKAQSNLRVYGSTAMHSSLAKALEIIGLGAHSFRQITTDAMGRVDVGLLQKTIIADMEDGLKPLAIVGTVGTVDIGAVDDIEALADFAQQHDIWLHIDGAFGALAILAPEIAPRLSGMKRADSIAFDFHKWGQATYVCGCLLVRSDDAHRAAFAGRASYLAGAARGLASADHWYCDYGPELSRSFKAMKVWFLLKEHGAKALGASIGKSCKLAALMETLVAKEAKLELLAPVQMNIVCFRYSGGSRDNFNALNSHIVAELQERGIAAPSTILLDGVLAIRCCFINHRTNASDVRAVIKAVLEIGDNSL